MYSQPTCMWCYIVPRHMHACMYVCMCVYLILSDDSTPEFIVVSEELGCSDSILVDHHHSDYMKQFGNITL